MKYYAVKAGKVPGIYSTWAECQAQTRGFSKAVFKSFKTLEEATAFVKGDSSDTSDYELNIYTDGSYSGKIAGGAAVIVEEKMVYYGSQEDTTNNRGELYGIYLAISNTTKSAIIHTDSLYSINVLVNGYTPRTNLDLIQKIQEISKGRKLLYKHVDAHVGIHYNEVADKYAKLACLVQGVKTDILRE